MTEAEFEALIQSLLLGGYTVDELEASAEQGNFKDEFGISLPNFAVGINAQTAIRGAAQTANSNYRTNNRIKKAQCNRSGGFNTGEGNNHQCLRGEDAVAHIEGIGENAPAYERAQEWLAEYNAEPGLDEDTTADDTTDDIGQFTKIKGTYQNVIDVLINEAGMSQEEADALWYSVLFDRTSQDAVTLEGILTREGFSVIGGVLLTPEENNDLFAEDTDGDGFVDTVVTYDATAEDGYAQVNGTTEEIDAQIAAAQQAKEDVYNQEGWDDLEDWEQDQQLINAGGYAINGTDGTEPEETSLSNKAKESINKLKDVFPTLDDLIAKLPKDPKEWGGAIRTVLETAGINLPSGDIDAILQGGYGVKWDPANSVFKDVLSGAVFVPGLPAGGTPSSVTIGTLEDLLKYPKETIQQRVEEIWGQISGDPVDFIKGIIASGAQLPDDFFDVLGGLVAAGSTFIDWAKDAAAQAADTTDEDTTVVDKTAGEDGTTAEDGLTFGGFPGEGTVDSPDVGETTNLVIPGGVTETKTNNGMLTGITEQDINGLYLSLLGRDAKQSGLDYWMGDVERGATLDDIEFNIKLSEEYKNLNANDDSGDFTFGGGSGVAQGGGGGGTNVLDLSGGSKDANDDSGDFTFGGYDGVDNTTVTGGGNLDLTGGDEVVVDSDKDKDEVTNTVVVDSDKDKDEVTNTVVVDSEKDKTPTPEIFTGEKPKPPEIVEPKPLEVFDTPEPEPEELFTEDPGSGGGGGGGGGGGRSPS